MATAKNRATEHDDAVTCVLGHAWTPGWVLCPTCGFGLRNRQLAPEASDPAEVGSASVVTADALVREAVLVGAGAPGGGSAGGAHGLAGEPEPILSPDGYWAWDGDTWVPAEQLVTTAPEPSADMGVGEPVDGVGDDRPAAEVADVSDMSAVAQPQVLDAEVREPAPTATDVPAGDLIETDATHRGTEADLLDHDRYADSHTDGVTDTADALDHDLDHDHDHDSDLDSDQGGDDDAETGTDHGPATGPRRLLGLDYRLVLGGLVLLTAAVSSDIAFGLAPLGHSSTASGAVHTSSAHPVVRAGGGTSNLAGTARPAPAAIAADLHGVIRAERSAFDHGKVFTSSNATLRGDGLTVAAGDHVLVASTPVSWCGVVGSGSAWYATSLGQPAARVGSRAYPTASSAEATCPGGTGVFLTLH